MAVNEPDPSLRFEHREHECLKADKAKAIIIEQMQNRLKDLENNN